MAFLINEYNVVDFLEVDHSQVSPPNSVSLVASSTKVWPFLSLNIERIRHQLCQYWPFVHASLSDFSALIFSKTSPLLLRSTLL